MGVIDDFKRGELNRKLIFLFLILAIEIPILYPLGIPIEITKASTDFYNFVENIPEDSAVCFVVDFGVMSWPPHGPMSLAAMRHLFQKPIKIVIVSFVIEGPIITQKLLAVIDKHGKEYGIDYVYLGYIPGGESGMAAFGENTHISEVDNYGNSLDKLTLMKEVQSKEDFYCFVWDSGTSKDPYFRQWLPVPQLGLTTAAGVPMIYPYYVSGDLKGYFNGVPGAAEYERLIKNPGFATAMMESISTIHLLGIILLIITNSKFIIEKFKGADV